MENQTVTMELTERQLIYIRNALEEHFRLRMGQVLTGSLTDDLAFQHVDLSENNPNKDADFDAALQRRDAGMAQLREYMNTCLGPGWERRRKTQEVVDEIDLWHAIRHFLWMQRPAEDRALLPWCVDADPTVQFGSEPLPKICVKLEEGT